MTRLAGVENFGPDTGAACMFAFTEYLKNTIGWTITAQSDGAGAAITHGGSGAGGFANTSAYRELQDPGGTRRFSWQRGTNNTLWRFKAMEQGGSTGGGPTEVPAGVNQTIVIGGGTDASPTYAQMLPTDSTYMFHGVADNVPVPGSNVYTFWYGTNNTGTVNCPSVVIVDGLQQGSYHPSDDAPMYVYAKYSTVSTFWCMPMTNSWNHTATSLWNSVAGNDGYMVAPMSATRQWQQCCGGTAGRGDGWFTAYVGSANQISLWPFASSTDGAVNFYVGRSNSNASPHGLKGMTYGWMLSFLPFSRNCGDTLNLTTSDAYVHFGTQTTGGALSMVLPWVSNVSMNLS